MKLKKMIVMVVGILLLAATTACSGDPAKGALEEFAQAVERACKKSSESGWDEITEELDRLLETYNVYSMRIYNREEIGGKISRIPFIAENSPGLKAVIVAVLDKKTKEFLVSDTMWSPRVLREAPIEKISKTLSIARFDNVGLGRWILENPKPRGDLWVVLATYKGKTEIVAISEHKESAISEGEYYPEWEKEFGKKARELRAESERKYREQKAWNKRQAEERDAKAEKERAEKEEQERLLPLRRQCAETIIRKAREQLAVAATLEQDARQRFLIKMRVENKGAEKIHRAVYAFTITNAAGNPVYRFGWEDTQQQYEAGEAYIRRLGVGSAEVYVNRTQSRRYPFMVLQKVQSGEYTLSCAVTVFLGERRVELEPKAILDEPARDSEGRLDHSVKALVGKTDGTCSYHGVTVVPDTIKSKPEVSKEMYEAFVQEEWEKQEQALAALTAEAKAKAEAMLGKIKISVALAPQVAGSFPELDITVSNGHDKLIETPSMQLAFYEDGALLEKVDVRVSGKVPPGETVTMKFSAASATRLVPHMKKETDIRARLTGFVCEKLKIDESGSVFIPEELLQR